MAQQQGTFQEAASLPPHGAFSEPSLELQGAWFCRVTLTELELFPRMAFPVMCASSFPSSSPQLLRVLG